MNNMMTKGLLLAATIAAGAMAATAPAAANNGKALTWGAMDYDNFNPPSVPTFQAEWDAITDPLQGGDKDIVMVGCRGCNAYVGDRDKTAGPTRMMCVVPGNEPEPVGWTALFSKFPQGNKAIANPLFYTAYSGHQVFLTKPIDVSNTASPQYVSITSRADGDQVCKDTLTNHPFYNASIHQNDAQNARMAEWHDNGVGGHNMGARIHRLSYAKTLLRNGSYGGSNGVRHWISINNQPDANLWP